MRIDVFLVEQKYFKSRGKAQQGIESGLVFVNDIVCKKASYDVKEDDKIKILEHEQYVSRGAYKLLGAIKVFDMEFKDKIVLDLGASTGGFTQVALENKAKKVYAVDIGKSELDEELIKNEKVVNLSNTDVRFLDKNLVGDSDIVVGDLSFISLTKIIPSILSILGNDKEMMLLFKPQFECGKDIAKKYKGVIKNKEIHKKILKEFVEFVKIFGFRINNIFYSPIKGGDGNIEYLLNFDKNKPINFNIDQIVDEAFSILKK